MPRDQKPLPKYFSQAELKRFFSMITDKRDKALFGLIYYYGMRVSEACLLSLSDLNLATARIRITRLKGSVSGEYRLVQPARRLLRAYLKVRRDTGTALFTTRQGDISRRMIDHLFVRYIARARLQGKRYTVHSLRHSIATHMLESDYGVEYVKDWLGHKAIASTMIYAQVTNRKRDELSRKLEYSSFVVKF